MNSRFSELTGRETCQPTFWFVCFEPGDANCPLLPLPTYSTAPPDFKKAAVCSSIVAVVNVAFAGFLLIIISRVTVGLFTNFKPHDTRNSKKLFGVGFDWPSAPLHVKSRIFSEA